MKKRLSIGKNQKKYSTPGLNSVKVLMLEDTPDDADLIKRSLQRAGFDFESMVVASKKEFLLALDSFSPDVVLSDHQLPQFSSTKALEICKKKFPFMAFVLVTGAVSEEFAASIIREGADDYLLKGNLKRLPTAILQAIKRNETERSLVESNERYDLVSKATSDAIWDWNVVEDVITWNHGLKTLFGYEGWKEDTESLWKEKIHPEDYDRVMDEMKDVVKKQKEFWISSYRYKHINGQYRHVLDRAHIIYKKSKPVRMIGAMQDVDERVKALEEVKRLSFVASKTDNSVLILDRELRIEWVNESFTRLTGYTLPEVLGKRPHEFLHGPETNAYKEKEIIEKSKLRKAYTDEILNYAKNGRKYWVRITVTPVMDDAGDVYKYVTIQSDVTEKKEAEDHLRLLESVITHANDAIVITEAVVERPGPKIIYVNEAFTKMTGYSSAEVIGKTPRLLQGSKTDRMELKKVRIALEKRVTVEAEVINYKKNGDEFWSNFVVVPIENREGQLTHFISIKRDVTARRFQEKLALERLETMVEKRTRELNLALNKEKDLVEMKNRFVSIASHEFRTPLSTISLAAESIRNYFHQLTSEEITRKLIKIEDQASHMTNLLEDILTLGKSDAGKIKVIRISLDLKDFLEGLIQEVLAMVREKREIVFAYSCAQDMVNADDKLLRNVVSNLLTNALKFSPSDSPVSFNVSSLKGGIIMEVKDEGIGIADDELSSIFESFQRGSNAANIQGTGLGLSILKKAVELMDGSIEIISKLNRGSTFTVRLPMV